MINNNNRNSRDDKSKPGNRSTSGSSRTGTGSSYKGKSAFGDKEGRDNKYAGAGRSAEGRPEAGSSYKGKRPFGDKDKEGTYSGAGRSSEGRSDAGSGYKGKRPFEGAGRNEGRSDAGTGYKGKRPFEGAGRSSEGRSDAGTGYKGKRPFENKDRAERPAGAGRPYEGRSESGTGFKGKRPFTDKPREYAAGSKRDFSETKGRSYIKKDQFEGTGDRPARKFDDKNAGVSRSTDSRPFRKRDSESGEFRPTFTGGKAPVMRVRKEQPKKEDDGMVRLNRYIANSGICSRRKADELIEAGVVSVNGEVVSELGHKVDPAKDEVRYNGELLKREKKTYVLLNKPKDYITTTDDPQERRTVMQLVEKASRERIYPVGRLDRNTTGLLLMTNDGDLADKLSHPKNGITKIYHVELNKSLSQGDLNKIQFGLELEDGLIKPDTVSYVSGGSKREVGIQIHSGKNRIVRRIFEHLGYEVVKLDRVVYGNLTKKDLPRGRWRYLEEHELIQIKHLIK
jgi:23S rRNA pseudouridine2605 synthase